MKRKEKRALRVKAKTEEVISAYRSQGELTDPNGMYTGNVVDPACAEGKIYINPKNDIPVQDADDL